MSRFYRQPEWQQPADRHTQLIDPVLTVRQLSRFDFNLKWFLRIDHALVFSTPDGTYEPYLPPRRPTRPEVVARRYTAVYEVDMGVHPYTADLTLPSNNDAFEFTAQIELAWQVLDPARFVAGGHRDVPGMLIGELQQAARPVTRRFAIADSAAAERELLQAVTVLGPLGAPAGLQVTWTLRLKRDQANIEHQQRLQAIEHSAAEQVHAAQRGMEVDVEVDRRLRQQDSLQVDRALAYGTQQHELLLRQQQWQHAQAMLRGQQDLELQQLEAQKTEFYQWHLQQGGVHAWALHLAQHPEDSQLVMTSMREDQLRMIQAQMDLVKQLLSGDTAENYELEGPKQLALRTVSDILNQRLPGVPSTPPQLPTPPGPAYPTAPQPTPPAEPLPTGPDQNGAGDAYGGGTAYAHPPMPASAPTPPPPAAPPGLALPGWQAPLPPTAPPTVPPPPSWQPPPGYGTTPTLPDQHAGPAAPSEPTGKKAEDGGAADGDQGNAP
ncbi:hypothetical protein [Streptomyces sp. NPDC002671]